MPRQIPLQPDLPHSQLLIRRDEVTQRAAAAACVERAHTQAQCLLEDAASQARLRLVAGYRDGYRDGVRVGVRAAMEPLVTIAAELSHIRLAAHHETRRRVRACFEALVERAPVLAALVEAALDVHARDTPAQIVVSLARLDEAGHHLLETTCRRMGVSLTVRETGQPGTFAIDWAGHRWEIDYAALERSTGDGDADEDRGTAAGIARHDSYQEAGSADAVPAPGELTPQHIVGLCQEALMRVAQDLDTRAPPSDTGGGTTG
ncbi:hypothetical protein [Burkholderia ambifaria]|uniref:hypothetical protein n=1 Tax=Burkholderia ambifaria TaxID=152480 RepID=UPI00158FDA29|nr:hypothetical protein [Burkholderia ambifaria]